MPKQLRVRLDPLPPPSPEQRLSVEGVRVGLLTLGAGASAASFDEKLPAELVFGATLLSKAHAGDSEKLTDLEKLSGTLVLPSGAAPVFEVTPETTLETPAAEVVGIGPRQLLLELDSATFTGAAAPLSIQLPDDLEGFEHLELEVELKLAGQSEATPEQNDVLDVPLSPRPLFTVRVTDQVGEPLSEVKLEFEWAGRTQVITTNAEGIAGVDRLGAEGAKVSFVDATELKERLKSLWAQPKEGLLVREAPGVVVLDSSRLGDPALLLTEQRLTLSLQPRVVQARMRGLLFETNKNFLLPESIASLRRIKQLYDEHPNSKLLIVGHTDTSGSAQTNDSLSLERAASMAAYLKDDVAAWEARYDTGVPESRRWGDREDLLMMTALNTPGAAVGVLGPELVKNFQTAHNRLPDSRRSSSFETLPTSGGLDAATRRQLIADYMNQDATTLPENIEVVTHGCGENFPLSAGEDRVDSEAADGEDDALDRRVELFFFDQEFDILPKPPGDNSKQGSSEYPEWRRRAQATHDLEADGHGPLVIGTPNSEEGEVVLQISEPGADQPLAILKKADAVDETTNLAFSVVAETLPSSVEFALLIDETLEYRSIAVDPLKIRNALFVGDVGRASSQLAKSDDSVQSRRRARQTSVGKDKQALQVLVQWQHNHGTKAQPKINRFLRDMKVTLKNAANNSPLPESSGSEPGSLIFDIPDDVDKLRFESRIRARRTGKQVLEIDESFTVERSPNSQTTMLPTSTLTARIRRFEFVAGPAKVSVILLDLDLLFLDVTEHVKALPKGSSNSGAFSSIRGITSDIAVLEFTGGEPTTWPVIFSPTLDPATDQTNVLLFFKNEALDSVNRQGEVVRGTHTDSDDANYVRALESYFRNPTTPGKYVGSEPGTGYLPYPNFGWDRQLRDSKKPVVVLFPIPHGEPFGVLENPSRASKSLIESALRALFAEGRLASGQRLAPQLERLAVGGWSSGVNTLFKWSVAKQTLDFIDELYVFDGLSEAQGIPIQVESWLKLKAGRRVRIIGTAYTEVSANRIQRDLKLKTVPNSAVFVHPGDAEYWYTNADYHSSLHAAGASGPPRFRSSGAPVSLLDASAATNLFIDRQTRTLIKGGIAVSARLTLDADGLGRAKIPNIAHEEAAALASLHRFVHSGQIPVVSKNAFDIVTGRLDRISGIKEEQTSFRHRHPWSVMGGLFNHKGRRFVGYFQLCLEESGF